MTSCVILNQVIIQPTGKIALPEDLIKPTIQWYYQVTGHPGSKRLYGQL
jgi:hypothetical protein